MCCDNMGENEAFIEACKKAGIEINFKETMPGTPQQNGLVERFFTTLYGHTRTMLNKAGFTKKKWNQMQAECNATATKVKVMMTDNPEEPLLYEAFYRKAALYAKHLKTFGEVCGKNVIIWTSFKASNCCCLI